MKSPDLEVEQRQLIERLRSNGEVRHLIDYTGDGTVFLGARYALACWIDELFIVHSAWADLWKERPFEVALYGSRERAGKFWDQADLVLRRPNAPACPDRARARRVETFFLCIVLGFRGRYLENPGEGSRVRRGDAAPGHPNHSLALPARPGSQDQRRTPCSAEPSFVGVIAIYGGLLLLVILILLILLENHR